MCKIVLNLYKQLNKDKMKNSKLNIENAPKSFILNKTISLIGYVAGRNCILYPGSVNDFKKLVYLGVSENYHHVLGDDRTVLVFESKDI